MRPHTWIREERQLAVLWVLAIATLVLGVVLYLLSPPGGWAAFELPALVDTNSPGSPHNWAPAERDTTLFALGLDFLFLIVYPMFLSLLCWRGSNRWNMPAWLVRTSLIFSALTLLAAPLDAVENIGLYFMLSGETSTMLQWFITAVAAPKLLIALTATIVALMCLAFRLLRGPKAW